MPAPARSSLMSSAMSKAANRSWRVSVRLPRAAVASCAPVDLGATEGDVPAAGGGAAARRRPIDIGHQIASARAAGRSGRSRLPPWSEAPGTSRAGEGVGSTARAGFGRRRPPRIHERLLDAANGGQGAFVSHGQGIARVRARQAAVAVDRGALPIKEPQRRQSPFLIAPKGLNGHRDRTLANAIRAS